MEKILKIRGWQIHHQEQLIYQSQCRHAKYKVEILSLSNYRQTVQIDKFPEQCKLKIKG